MKEVHKGMKITADESSAPSSTLRGASSRTASTPRLATIVMAVEATKETSSPRRRKTRPT